jgi:hypothetical protein
VSENKNSRGAARDGVCPASKKEIDCLDCVHFAGRPGVDGYCYYPTVMRTLRRVAEDAVGR